MAWLRNIFDKLVGIRRDEGPTPEQLEELKAACSAQHHHFQMLLAANSKSLELMSDMEELLHGGRVFGMSFIRATCTAVLVNVYSIIQHLDGIAPGKYTRLFTRFEDIQRKVTEALVPTRAKQHMDLVVPLEYVDKSLADVVGSKMANIGEMTSRIGLPVPAGFVVTARGFDEFMRQGGLQEEINRMLLSTRVEDMSARFSLSAAIQQRIMQTELPPELTRSLERQYERLRAECGRNMRISLRSSALGEDAAGTSFAGQFRTILNVDREFLPQAYKEVVASLYGLPALSYRLTRGIRDEDVAMCVGGMVMVRSVAGGVMYSRSPINVRDDAVFINSVWGLPKLVVDGGATPDRFVVARGKHEDPAEGLRMREHTIAVKPELYVCRDNEGVLLVEQDPARAVQASLTETQALQLAEMAVRLERYYGVPQDIEWTLDESGQLYILQCRPLARRDIGEPPVQAEHRHYGESITSGGATASPGVGCGPVFVVERDADALQFPPGSVLVTRLSLPKWASLLNWCAAVVTEQGSVTGHLANVAREFGVPAITGQAGALERLKPGTVVTVDADACVVYPGCIEELIARGQPRPDLMKGSPVYELLKDISRFIIPLNLLDPDSPDFRIRNIETLHDVTRYCHEKSVQEMFELNMNRDFRECGSRQLVVGGSPTQFWVVDLEDGFIREEPGPFVRIGNIASTPMLALWEGISAIPWEGPPSVNAKGFMSIVAEATTNPALHPALQSKFANRNYFLVSKEYCNLQSRFGFHFSTVEAVVGDRPQRNYINFRFAGGAADFERRRRRAAFIGGILEEIGFYVNVRSDNVLARYEGFPKDAMCERLVVMGYLTMHTRQLDMIMADAAATRMHRTKIMADIDKLLTGKARCPEAVSS
ncbi:pyruvate,water dikinase [Desulfobaculum xiamenense]|uniref:Phosphoenolpyruvate synthase n=1 Tax=Desulfobaculum xiamenense TaxID=995050 RepID=A0A846QR42_9BACT|nr:PEP/pyruvate-binding domain-containing protein [Desulfobaculum xiamenense]NJB68843.1 pyruvate,water dikinase [Desulfobaculum xiamenense]